MRPGCEYELVTQEKHAYREKSGWTGETAFVKSQLEKPLHWKRPRAIFVCSMGDLFHESVPFELIDKVFAVMALCPQHRFMLLTKRPERMAEYFLSALPWRGGKPYENIWIGTSVEDQQTANERIPHLLKCPAALRYLSVEPMLGEIDIKSIKYKNIYHPHTGEFIASLYCNPLTGWCATSEYSATENGPKVGWVICGGESGHNARPMHPNWVRKLRDQCQNAQVPFMMKQWGEWHPNCLCTGTFKHCKTTARPMPGSRGVMFRCGKHAGRMLDGVIHDEYPEVKRDAKE
jgi:protein gp37